MTGGGVSLRAQRSNLIFAVWPLEEFEYWLKASASFKERLYSKVYVKTAVITKHACDQMFRRRITEEQVRDVLKRQEEIIEVRPGIVVVQAVNTTGAPPTGYLIRVFLDIDRTPPEVKTVYRTSKIEKYRRQQ